MFAQDIGGDPGERYSAAPGLRFRWSEVKVSRDLYDVAQLTADAEGARRQIVDEFGGDSPEAMVAWAKRRLAQFGDARTLEPMGAV